VAEYRTLTSLVPRIAAGTLLMLVAATYLTGNNKSGAFNKPIYVGILLIALVVAAIFLRRPHSGAFDVALAVLASLGLVWGIATIERPQLASAGYWLGFGGKVAIGVAVLLLILGALPRPQSYPAPARIALGVIVVACCLCDLTGAIRTIDYMPYVNNNLNEINDVLGPAAGKIPESTFIPQYSALYGWLFVPLQHVLSPAGLVAAMSIFFTLLGIATVGLAVWIVRRALGTKGIVLPLALVVPLTFVTSPLAGDVSSIASLFQELPIRLFSGFAIIAVGLGDLVLLYRGSLRPRHLLLIGALCGVIAWNSQDFGVAATVVYGLMVLACSMPPARIRAFGLWAAGLVVGVASYPLFLLAIGSPLNLSFVAVYVKLFGSGIGAAPIQVPGPVLIVVPIIFCATASGWALLRLRRREAATPDAQLDIATVTLALVGTWSAVCLVYYINRAYAPGQLQTMLLPCAVCVAAMLAVVLHAPGVHTVLDRKPGRFQARWSDRLKLIPVGIFVCLCFASALRTTNPVAAARDLLNPAPGSGYINYDLPDVIAAVDRAKAYTAQRTGQLTYLGESFNYVSLATRVPSNAILYPFPLAAITSVTQIECQYLRDHHSQWMVLSANGVEAFGSSACGIYHAVDVPGLAFGQLQELR
jgi:hypothetical protein